MPTFSASREIAAPAALVWELLADVVAWPKWLPTVSRVEPVLSKELVVGATFKVVQPRLKPVLWTVSTLNPGCNFIWESSNPGLTLWANHTVEALSDGHSQIKLEFRFSGFMAPLVALLAGAITKRYLSTEAESLKQLAEANAKSEAYRSFTPTRGH